MSEILQTSFAKINLILSEIIRMPKSLEKLTPRIYCQIAWWRITLRITLKLFVLNNHVLEIGVKTWNKNILRKLYKYSFIFFNNMISNFKHNSSVQTHVFSSLNKPYDK